MWEPRFLFVCFALLATWLFAPYALAQSETSDTVEQASGLARSASDLRDIIESAVEEHDRLLSARATADADRERARETLGQWFPSLDLTLDTIRERIAREGGDAVKLDSQEVTVSITQLLWDFGATNATVESARLSHVQSEIAVVRTRQELISEALSAYAELLRSVDVLAFAKQSEENIRTQTELEDIRITAGSGLSTDLLQAKTQLAGAQARRVDAEGALDLALNRYRAVFGDVPANLDSLPGVTLDRSGLPAALEEALALAFSRNPEIRETSIDVAISKQDRRSTYSEFLPTVELIGESKALDNDGGAVGTRTESSMTVSLTWPFNLGFTAINTLRAAQSDISASSRTLADLRRTLEERVRNAWKQLQTAQTRAGFLFDQADIARAFLDVAIEERRLGQRSLIDVLSGETALINAQSDAISAETEVTLAAIQLLAATGDLNYTQITEKPRPDRSVEFQRGDPTGGAFGADIGTTFDPSALGDGDGVLDPNAVFQPPPADEGGVFDPDAVLDPTAPVEDPLSVEDPTAPDSQLQSQPGPAPAPQPEPGPAVSVEPAVEPVPDGGVAPESEPLLSPEPSFESEVAPDAILVPAPQPAPEPEPVPQPESQPEPAATPEPVSEPAPAPAVEPETEPAPEDMPSTESEAETPSEPDPAPAPQPEPASQPAADPAATPAPEPAPEPAAPLQPESPSEPKPDPTPAPAPANETGIPNLFEESLNGGTTFDVDQPPATEPTGQGDQELDSPLLKWAQ